MGAHISGCFSALQLLVDASGLSSWRRSYSSPTRANSAMLFEVGRLPKSTMGQPDVLPADMVRLTASLVQAHMRTHRQINKQLGREMNG